MPAECYSCTATMIVGTHHFTLGDLGKNHRPVLTVLDHLANPCHFVTQVIKVQNNYVSLSAVNARVRP